MHVLLIFVFLIFSVGFGHAESAAEFFRKDQEIKHQQSTEEVKPQKKIRYRNKRTTGCANPTLLKFVRRVGGRVVSAHRPGAYIKGTRRPSLHRYCSAKKGAIDFKPRRGTYRKTVRMARSRGFGVGTYSGCMHHVHISIGGNETRFHKYVRCKKKRYYAGR